MLQTNPLTFLKYFVISPCCAGDNVYSSNLSVTFLETFPTSLLILFQFIVTYPDCEASCNGVLKNDQVLGNGYLGGNGIFV
jgi:hypothetical protein